MVIYGGEKKWKGQGYKFGLLYHFVDFTVEAYKWFFKLQNKKCLKQHLNIKKKLPDIWIQFMGLPQTEPTLI